MEEEFNLSEILWFRGRYIPVEDVKEFIKRLKEESADKDSFTDKNHILYPWRMCRSETKSQVKDIYNLILHRLNLRVDKLAGDRLMENK